MHIVQVAPCFVDLQNETGGVSNIVRRIALGLARKNHRITLICGNRELGVTKAQAGTRRHSSNLVQCIHHQRSHPLLGPAIDFSSLNADPTEHLVVHVHTCFSTFTESAMSYCSKFRIPFILTPHGKLSPIMLTRHSTLKSLYWRIHLKRIVNSANGIILSSAMEAIAFNRLGIHKPYMVIHNGYDEESLKRAHIYTKIFDDPYILYLGYLDKRKQPAFVIDIFRHSRIVRTHKLVFAGPDPYGQRVRLENMVNRCGLSDRVIFYGPAYGHEKWNLLKRASCLCLPSKAEGLPVVLCEAVGANVPALYSSACNFPELAQAGCGVELGNFDIPLWKESLERICLDENVNLRMREAADLIKPNYSWNSICNKWEDAYLESVPKR